MRLDNHVVDGLKFGRIGLRLPVFEVGEGQRVFKPSVPLRYRLLSLDCFSTLLIPVILRCRIRGLILSQLMDFLRTLGASGGQKRPESEMTREADRDWPTHRLGYVGRKYPRTGRDCVKSEDSWARGSS